MTRIMAEIFRHHLWANLTIVDQCAGLNDAQLGTTSPGAFGAIAQTVAHLAAAEGRYVAAITGKAVDPGISEKVPFPGVTAIRRSLAESGERLIAIAEAEVDDRVVKGVRGAEPFATPLSIFITQSLEHGQEHRRQVAASLAQLGFGALDLSGWAFDDFHAAQRDQRVRAGDFPSTIRTRDLGDDRSHVGQW